MNLSTNNYLKPGYLENRNKGLRYHSEISHPLYKQELKNGSTAIVSFLNNTILGQARNLRNKFLYDLSAEKCFNNNVNNYTFSEAVECERLLFSMDPVLNNIANFEKHIETEIEANHQDALKGIECSKDYYKAHKEFLNELNTQKRVDYYNNAKNLFIDSLY